MILQSLSVLDKYLPNERQTDLYIIQEIVEPFRIKIGIASDVKKRFSQIQTSCANELNVIYIAKNLGYLEKKIHNDLKISGYHCRGEWFSTESINNAFAYLDNKPLMMEILFKYLPDLPNNFSLNKFKEIHEEQKRLLQKKYKDKIQN
jgi:hypothetical protein